MTVGDEVDGARDADRVSVLRPQRDLERHFGLSVVELREVGADVFRPALRAHLRVEHEVVNSLVLRVLDVVPIPVEQELFGGCTDVLFGDVAVEVLLDAVVDGRPDECRVRSCLVPFGADDCLPSPFGASECGVEMWVTSSISSVIICPPLQLIDSPRDQTVKLAVHEVADFAGVDVGRPDAHLVKVAERDHRFALHTDGAWFAATALPSAMSVYNLTM